MSSFFPGRAVGMERLASRFVSSVIFRGDDPDPDG